MPTLTCSGANYAPDQQLLDEAIPLRSHPAFEDALRDYTNGLARLRETSSLINKLLSRGTHFRVVGLLLYADADRASWPQGANYSLLHEMCAHGYYTVSPRVLKTMLALLQLGRFVEVLRDAGDRRLKFYRPAARMLDFVRQWLRHATLALDTLQPQGQRTRLLDADADFVRRFLVTRGAALLAEPPPATPVPEFVQFFGMREGGSAIVFAVMAAALNRTALPSRARIGKHYSLSKTQISNIIADGAKSGFFTLDDKSVPAPTAHLHDAYRQWMAIELAFYARHLAAVP